MEAPPDDFRELLALLNSHEVEYVIVGGYALAFHGAPRFTGDLDVLVRPDAANAERVMAALAEFGFGDVGLTADDFETAGAVVQLGVPPFRVDIVTSVDAVSWEQVDRGKQHGTFCEVPVHYIGRSEFLVNKKAVGRKKDLADIEALGDEAE